MDGIIESQSWLQWVFGAVVTGTLAGLGYTNRRIGAVEKKSSEDDDKLWAAHDSERSLNSSFRERFSEKVAALPTKDDLAQMETRIMSAIERGRR